MLTKIKNYIKSKILKSEVNSLSKSGEITIKSNGTTISMPDDMLWAFENGEYYERNVNYFLDLIFSKYEKPVFIDIGANYGYYTVKFATDCSQVICFEPVSSTHRILAENIKSNQLSNVTTHKLGLSNENGELTINLYSSSGNNSIFERNIPDEHPLKKIGIEKIQLETLDELLQTQNNIAPDIIKIDVEGAELKVLEGAAATISAFQPTIVIEYSETTSIDAGYNREKMLEKFRLPGYVVYGIAEDPNDFRLIAEKDFASEQISNLIIVPNKIDLLK